MFGTAQSPVTSPPMNLARSSPSLAQSMVSKLPSAQPGHRCLGVNVDHVPGHGVGFHHGAHLGDFTAVLGFRHLVAGSLMKGS